MGYDKKMSLFDIKRAKKKRLCFMQCLNCSLYAMLFREIYLLIIYLSNTLCPCCLTTNCLNLQQQIYDIKKYQNYFGHLPPEKSINSNINIMPNKNKNDIDSLPNNSKHGIFVSPPQILQNAERRVSQSSICGVPINENYENNRHRKQSSILLELNNDNINEFGLTLSEDSDSSFGDLQVPQQIIDQDADAEDVILDDTKSETYDNFAEIMIQREREYLYNNSNKTKTKIISDKNRRQSVEYQVVKGSIPNLGKKRRGSLILNAVDNIKNGIFNLKEKQQQKKYDAIKEAKFMESAKNKYQNDQYQEHGDDEKEYYRNTEKSHIGHKRSFDRLSAVRNSLKSIIPKRNKYKKEQNDGYN